MVVVCLPVWAGWDVVMLAVCVLPVRFFFARRRAAVASRGAEWRALWREVPAAAGGPAVLGRGCERVACEGMWGRRRALAVASGAVFEPGRGGSCCEGSAARGSRCGTWRGGGVVGGPDHLGDESAVSRWFVPGVACRCVGGGAVAGLGISSAFGFASRLLKLLSVAGFSPCGGHRMCCGATERSGFRLGVSAHCFIVCVPVSVGLSRCTAVVLAASLPVGDRGARSGRFFRSLVCRLR